MTGISRINKLLFLVFLILSLAGLTFAQTDNIAAQAAQVTEFDVNGLKVLVKRRASAPTVAVGLFVRGGVRNVTDKEAGIENLMLRSAIEAGKKYNRQTVRRELSRTGSGIGSVVSRDYSAVSLGATRPNFDKVWDIFTDVMLYPAFAPDDVMRNRAAILAGLSESETTPEGALEAELARRVYAGHPYAIDADGTAASIGKFTAEDLLAYHKKIMQTSHLLLVFVGDLDPNEIKARVTESFGKLPRGDYKEQPYPAINFSGSTVDIVARPSLPTNYVEGVFNAPSLANPDYYPMKVAVAILQGLVHQEVRVNRQLSYAPNAELDNFGANTANISVSAVDANQSVAVMLEQIQFLQTRALRDDVVSEVAGNFLTTYYLTQETSGAQVGELARYELLGGGWRNSFEFLNRIRQVKAKDLQDVSNKYMKNIRFVVVGNPASVDKKIFLQGTTE
ncbi:MAG TPA: pitrilysin family protein [Pyrinomonadaceae bacterium]|jgi:predicted Zn-dependent peptidase|nr:pitrilysin family protein [Pyrinomonadaceae bacterium]